MAYPSSDLETVVRRALWSQPRPWRTSCEVKPQSGRNLGKGAEKSNGKEEEYSSDSGSKEGEDKRKCNPVIEKVLDVNSNPSSPSIAKCQRI
uniref:Uncharacterized protein n=1 Tax=Vombatus ursinus TaxID=29139 RepID=A0A4X2KC63_VOMUR